MTARSLPLRFWLLTAASLAMAVLTLNLGLWQLARAHQKIAMREAIERQQQLPAADATALGPGVSADLVYRTIHIRGSWLAGHTVFLDNRQMNGKVGFFVLTPLKLENAPLAVLVQRGWAQRSFVDRAALPAVATPTGTVEVTGRIAPPPSKLYEFAPSGRGTIRQNLDIVGFSTEVGVPLAPLSVMQLDAAADGLARDWPVVDTGVEKHYGYAFQWFALCGLIVLLYAWFQIVRRFISPR